MNPIGSLAWAYQNGGRLTLRERLLFTGSALQAALVRRWRRPPSPFRADDARLNLEKLSFPDSRLVTEVFSLCEAAYEPWLLNHCLRSYLWGGLVGQLEGVKFDPEAQLVIALLHDLALTHAPPAENPKDCFAVRGARLAQKTLTDLGHPDLAPGAAESISMHLNISVSRREPSTSYLLHQGAAIDVVGWGSRKIRPYKDLVLEKYPRLGFKNRFARVITEEARGQTHTRLAWLIRFGFKGMIQKAPYLE
jgi:hypothetical protein